MTKKKTGVRKMPNSVTPSMPLKTAVPSVRRISAPAPSASTSGTTPRMKANEVIMIGRSRSRQASSVASRPATPASRCCLANSTIRMAFLLASPTSTTKPICVKMLMSIRARATPAIEHSRHIGTTRITASGSDQLSYWAASTRNTSTTASSEHVHRRVAGQVLQQGQLGPLDCAWLAASSLSARRFHQRHGLAGAGARGDVAVDRRGRVHVVAHHHHRAGDVADGGHGVDGNHLAARLRTFSSPDVFDAAAKLVRRPGG